MAEAGSSRGGRAQGDGRCDGDNEDARRCDDETEICRTGEVDIGRRRAVATDRLRRLGEAESLIPKSMTCRPAHPAHPAWDSAGESQANQHREPLCHSVFSARPPDARALTGRPPEPSSRIKPRADSTSEVTMPFRRPNNMTAATGRGAERCWAGSAAVQESPSPLLHATRPPERRASEGRCSAGLALIRGDGSPAGGFSSPGGHGGLFCDRTDVGLFLRPASCIQPLPPWDSHKQPELARCPLNPSAKASWSQPFDVAALQWFRRIGPARWIDVLAVQKNACKKVLSPPACQYRVPPRWPEIENSCFPVHPQAHR